MPPDEGGPHAIDVESAEGGVHRRANLGLVGGQVVARDPAVVLLHVPGDELGSPPGVELVGSPGGDPFQRCGQVGLDEPVAGLPRALVGPSRKPPPTPGNRPAGRSRRAVAAPRAGRSRFQLRVERPGKVGRDRESVPSQFRGGPDQVGPGGLSPAAWASPRPRTGPGTPAAQAPARWRGRSLPSRSRYILGIGSRRRHLAEIDRDDLPPIGQVSHDEPAAARYCPASGSVTARANAVAIAASIALPPWRSTSRPTSAACPSWATTTCLVKVSSARDRLGEERFPPGG